MALRSWHLISIYFAVGAFGIFILVLLYCFLRRKCAEDDHDVPKGRQWRVAMKSQGRGANSRQGLLQMTASPPALRDHEADEDRAAAEVHDHEPLEEEDIDDVRAGRIGRMGLGPHPQSEAYSVIDPDDLGVIESEETDERRRIEQSRNYKVECWFRNTVRMGRWLQEHGRTVGSLGVVVTKDRPGVLVPVRIEKVKPDGAASRAVVSRKTGPPLPEGERRILPGDLVIKVTTEHTQRRFKCGEVSGIYGDDSWPVMKRTHLMVALGPLGCVWAGSPITLWLVRDPDFIDRWLTALEKYQEQHDWYGRGPAAPEPAFLDTVEFSESPIPIDLAEHADLFPVPEDDVLIRADIVMAEQSKQSERVRQHQLSRLQRITGASIDRKKLYELQTIPSRAREVIREVFDRFDINGDGYLQFAEMRQVHDTLTAELGIPALGEEELRLEFDEADVNDDKKLSFDEYFYYLRDQILECCFRMEESDSRLASSPLANAGPRGAGLMSIRRDAPESARRDPSLSPSPRGSRGSPR